MHVIVLSNTVFANMHYTAPTTSTEATNLSTSQAGQTPRAQDHTTARPHGSSVLDLGTMHTSRAGAQGSNTIAGAQTQRERDSRPPAPNLGADSTKPGSGIKGVNHKPKSSAHSKIKSDGLDDGHSNSENHRSSKYRKVGATYWTTERGTHSNTSDTLQALEERTRAAQSRADTTRNGLGSSARDQRESKVRSCGVSLYFSFSSFSPHPNPHIHV